MTHDYSEDKVPSLFTRWFAWLLIGTFSVFFAEVTIGNTPLVFLQLDGLFIIAPIYALHTLILASLVIRKNENFSIYMLIAAGLFFGLYEAYMTKVLWIPTWEPEPFQVAGLALFATLILVPFWHLYISFIVPLFVSEGLLFKSHALAESLPGKWREKLFSRNNLILFSILLGMINGTTLKDLGIILLSWFSSMLLILVLIFIWMRRIKGYLYDLKDLLPGKRETWGLAGILFAYYVVMGFITRPEIIPDIQGQIAIWVLYALFAGLFLLTKKSFRRQSELGLIEKSDLVNSESLRNPIAFDPGTQFTAAVKRWSLFILSYGFSAVLSGIFLSFANDIIMKVLLLAGAGFGLYILGRTIYFGFKGIFIRKK